MVFVTCDPSDPAQRLCGVDVGSERDHGFDVDPVLGSIEHRLADAEVGGGEHANRVIGERHSDGCGFRGGVKRVVGEEEVDWCVVPHVPRLAVAGQRLGDGVGVDSELAEWLEYLCGPLYGYENVHIDVDRGSRLGVIGERDRTTESVWYCCQGTINCEDLVGQRQAGHDESIRG